VENTVPEMQLELGKVQNLRRACARINGAIVPAGKIFSFWKQVGRATPGRGFATGRLLREGCLMPAVGGGLCALSNALYEAAVTAELEIVERHAHSRRIPGSRAAITGLDATVAWNYVDLRFRCQQEFQITARLTRQELVIQLRGRVPRPRGVTPSTTPLIQIGLGQRPLDIGAHSCGSCHQTSCRHHQVSSRTHKARTAWLLDENWPEFQRYMAETWANDDLVLLPLDGNRWRQPRYRWQLPSGSVPCDAALLALMRSLRCRQAPAGGRRTLANLEATRAIARVLAARLTPDVTRLVVAQSMLPFLAENGDLGGREIHILATRLPFKELHARLDAAHQYYGSIESLQDFRAPELWVEAEDWGFEVAGQIVTPHTAIADYAKAKAWCLDWVLPARNGTAMGDERAVIFPGPAMARRGALEVRQVARELGLTVYLDSTVSEGMDFWNGVRHRYVTPAEGYPSTTLAAVAPCWVEGRPQGLLRAYAARIPVVATPACGMAGLVQVVAPGDAAGLKQMLTELLSGTAQSQSVPELIAY
jgi:hypothetical protein